MLPPQPSGTFAHISTFLHCDFRARPHQVLDTKGALEAIDMLTGLEALCSYQMNHVWIVTLKSLEAKKRLLSYKELQLKGKRCLILNPNKSKVRLILHWVPFHLPNAVVRATLQPHGNGQEVARDTFCIPGLQGVEPPDW